jgi:hypothetical protein
MESSAQSRFPRAVKYAFSLNWLAAMVAVAAVISNVVELFLFDFVHGNPHRSQQNALEMMALYSPILALIAFIGTLLCFGPSQLLQAVAAGWLSRRIDTRFLASMTLLLPVAAAITWYSYDYLTPSDFNLAINEGPDWQPYQHGITVTRYLGAIAAQLPISVFSAIHVSTVDYPFYRRALVVSSLTLAVVGGATWGYRLAAADIQLL